jgi:hypothetical protein
VNRATLEIDGLKFWISYSLKDGMGTIYADSQTISTLIGQAGKNAVLHQKKQEPVPVCVLDNQRDVQGNRSSSAVGFLVRD